MRSTRRRWAGSVVASVVAVLLGAVTLVVAPAADAFPLGFARFSGRVTDGGGMPRPGITVEVLDPLWGTTVTTATTDGAGAYTRGVLAGSYRLRFHDPAGTFADAYAGGATTFPASPVLTIASGVTMTVDGTVTPGDHLVGTLTTPSSTPAPGITVELIDADGFASHAATTGGDGGYGFDGVPAGTYTVRAEDPTGAYATSYGGGSRTRAGATTVTTGSGGTHTLDVALTGAGTIGGSATIGGRTAAAGVYALIVDPPTGELLAATPTGADGTWSIPGVAPGDVVVAFLDPATLADVTTGLRPVFAPAADMRSTSIDAARAAATPQPVTAGATTTVPAIALAGADCDPTTHHPGSDLWGTDQSGADLRGCPLAAARLAGADLTGTDLRWADLADSAFGTVWTTGNWDHVIFEYDSPAPMAGARLRGADLDNAVIETAQLLATDHDWRGTDLSDTSDATFPPVGVVYTVPPQLTSPGLLGQVHLSDQDLEAATPPVQLAGASFTATDFSRADLLGLDLSGLRCPGCDLTDADLTGADVTGAVLTNARITGADLSNAVGATRAQLVATTDDWRGTSFTGIDLSGANLYGSLVTGASFRDGSLANTNLSGLNLNGVDLTGTDLTGATIIGTNFRASTGLTRAQLVGTADSWSSVVLTGTGVDLSGLDLRARTLTYADLSGLDLHGSNLAGVNLFGTSLAGTDLTDVDLTGAALRSTSFTGATGLTRAMLLSAARDWRGIRLDGTGVDLSLIDFAAGGWQLAGSVVLTGLDLHGSVLSGLNLQSPGGGPPGANLAGTNLAGAQLVGTTLTYADLSGADLTGATLTGAQISYADLSGATGLTTAMLTATDHAWSGTRLAGTGVDLSGIDFNAGAYTLTGADLSGLHLTNAVLTSRNLANAKLVGTDLRGANVSAGSLANADLTGADLTGARFYLTGTGGARFTGANLTNARNLTYNQVALANRSFVGTTFTGSSVVFSNQKVDLDLTGAALTNTSFANANLTGTVLAGAILTGTTFAGATGAPSGGSTAIYATTTCPDLVVASSPATCVGHGFGA